VEEVEELDSVAEVEVEASPPEAAVWACLATMVVAHTMVAGFLATMVVAYTMVAVARLRAVLAAAELGVPDYVVAERIVAAPHVVAGVAAVALDNWSLLVEVAVRILPKRSTGTWALGLASLIT